LDPQVGSTWDLGVRHLESHFFYFEISKHTKINKHVFFFVFELEFSWFVDEFSQNIKDVI
jgi:hypothetical protein